MVKELKLRQEELVWREIDNELIAVDVAASAYLSANPAGALLWQMLAEGTTRQELIDNLVERFGISSEQAATDVDAFLQSLEARRLLAP
jgi:hypothetical protein